MAAYTIRRPNNSEANNRAKRYREISDYIPSYDEENQLAGFKQYTASNSSDTVFINFFDKNKKFILRRRSGLDRRAVIERFGVFSH